VILFHAALNLLQTNVHRRRVGALADGLELGLVGLILVNELVVQALKQLKIFQLVADEKSIQLILLEMFVEAKLVKNVLGIFVYF
jgi:hypothetical protein